MPRDLLAEIGSPQPRQGSSFGRDLIGETTALDRTAESVLGGPASPSPVAPSPTVRALRERPRALAPDATSAERLQHGLAMDQARAGDRRAARYEDQRQAATTSRVADEEAHADTWAQTGRKFVSRILPLLAQSAGGTIQSMMESAAQPHSFGDVGSAASEQMLSDVEELRSLGRVPGQQMYRAATRDLEANQYNPGSSLSKKYLAMIAESTTQMLPSIAATLVTRNPAAGVAAMMPQVYGQQYGESREAGRTVAQSTSDSIFMAASEALGEEIPLGMMMRPGGRFLTNTLKTAGAEGLQEVFTQVLQSGYDKGVLHPDMPWGEVLQQVVDAGIVGAGMGASMHTISHPFTGHEAPGPTPESIDANAAATAAMDPNGYNPGDRRQYAAPMAGAAPARAPVTAEDAASPLPTDLIAQGKATIQAATQQSNSDRILAQYGFPAVGTPITLNHPNGNAIEGTVADTFTTPGDQGGEDQHGVHIDLPEGGRFSEYLPDLRDAGFTAAPRTAPRPAAGETSYAAVPFSQVKARIIGRESASSGGYNAVVYGEHAPKPVTSMTMGEVYDFQRGALRDRTRGRRGAEDVGSTGMGAYQFESRTLAQNAEAVFGTDWRNQTFTAENQDRVAEHLFNTVRGNPRALANTWAVFAGGGGTANATPTASPAVDEPARGPRLSDEPLSTARVEMPAEAPRQQIEEPAAPLGDTSPPSPTPAAPPPPAAPAATIEPTPSGKGIIVKGADQSVLDAIAKAVPKASGVPGRSGVTYSAKYRDAIEQVLSSSTPAAEQKESGAAPVSFTTAKGSTYRVEADGTTTRDKAARPEHPGEQGPQPTSEATHYVTAEDALKLAEFQAEGQGKVAIQPLPDGSGRVGLRYLDGKDAGRFEARTVVTPQDSPAVGLTPVETWKDGTRVHFGNEIASISTRPDTTEAVASPPSLSADQQRASMNVSPTLSGGMPIEQAAAAARAAPKQDALKAKMAAKTGDLRMADYTGKVINSDDATEQADYPYKGGTKERFHNDASAYLKAVAQQLAPEGFAPRPDRKGKPGKAVSVNKGGTAVSGEVSLSLAHPGGGGVYAQIAQGSMGGKRGFELMARRSTPEDPYGTRGGNQWLDTGLTAKELATKLREIARVGEHAPAAKPADRSATIVIDPAKGTVTNVTAEENKRRNQDASTAADEGSGASAFREGQPRVPPATFSAVMKERWLRGWDQANLAAPVEGVTEPVTPSVRRPTDRMNSNPFLRNGETVKLTKDIGYLSAGRTYAVESASNRSVNFRNVDTGGASTLNNFEIERGLKDGSIERVDSVTPPEQSAKPQDGAAVARPAHNREAEGSIPSPATTPSYGADNKLVSRERADELRAKLKAKMNQLNSGIDPEALAMFTELGVFHIEAGARRFVDFAKAIVADLGIGWDKARPFLRSAYNGARDTMEDHGHPVGGMDGPEQVRAALADLYREGGIATISATQEKGSGDQGAVSARDAGAGAEDVQRTAPDGRDGRAPSAEGGGSSGDVRAVGGDRAETAERAGGERAAAAGDRGTSAGSADRVPGERGAGRGRRTDSRDRAAERVAGQNWLIEPGSLDEARSAAVKARDNVRAIEIVKEIDRTGAPATREQQAALAKYVGWGGLKNAFNETNGTFAKGFEKIGPALKEMLTAEEYDTARQSIQYAHYTSEKIIRPMWEAVAQMGFKGGKVFEPGMGTGNFLGMMPAELAAATQYEGLEFDGVTARIAQLLYPQSGIRHADYTQGVMPKDAYDLVIGNPPFSGTVVRSDPTYGKMGFVLHDFFFAKSLDAVRPGGLLMFVTSAGTMNKIEPKARQYLADRADLLGAVRLPGGAFRENAGTDVTTDIIVLKKRAPGAAPGSRAWVDTGRIQLDSRSGGKVDADVNRYFLDNPEQILGEQGMFDTLTAGERYGVRPREGANMTADLRAAFDRVISQGQFDAWTGPVNDFDTESTERKEGSFYLKDGRLMQHRGGLGAPVENRGKGVKGGIPAADQEKVRGLVPIRDALRDVLRHDLAGRTKDAEAARKVLNEHYDRFVQQHGPINKADIRYQRPSVVQQEKARDEAREETRLAGGFFNEGSFTPDLDLKTTERAALRREAREASEKLGREWDEGDFDPADMPDNVIVKRPNVDAFMEDQEGYRLRSIEHYNDDTGEAKKGDIFYRNVVSQDRPPEIRGAGDALLYVLNRVGRPEIDEIAMRAGLARDEALDQLGDKVFQTPGSNGTYQTREQYLSGNVKEKLALARAAAERDPDFRRNVTALEAVQPPPLGPSDISVNLGMPWVPTKVIEDFGKALGLARISAVYRPRLAQWGVSGDSYSAAARSEWGTPRRDATALLNDLLNRQETKVFDTVRDAEGRERQVLNQEDTVAAQDKARAIKARFAEWVWEDAARATDLVSIYNDRFNNMVAPDYDGAYLTTPGIAESWSWRPHQQRVVARIIQAGNTYMAHAVGAGKTSAMIGAGMEMRRLGLVRKPMYAVPNHMLGQFTKEFYEQYPTAKIMVADERAFHTDRRKQFVANVATSDLDAVIITHSAFGYIPISDEYRDQKLREQLEEYRDILNELKAERSGDPGQRVTQRNIESAIEKMKQKLSGRAKRSDQVFTFEETGVDFLFVDEAHLFRKLDFATRMGNVRGVDPNGSAMSYDLFLKTRYLEERNPGRSHVLASGTPITNTMAELFSIQRYLQPQELAKRGIDQFDAWAGAFGETQTALEPDPAGGLRPQTRFARFVNVADLSAMVRQVMDSVTSEQLGQYVVRPTLKDGRRQQVFVEPTDDFAAYQQVLERRMKAIEKRTGKPKKGDDILLSVIGDGRKAAIDMRLVDPSLRKADTKLERLIENVSRIAKESRSQPFHRVEGEAYSAKPAMRGPATQMIFSDLGINGDFPIHRYIKGELLKRGLKEKEVAIISDFKSHVARQRLFNDMNEGKVRVLIGSVPKMGTGVNAQRRLLAIHNLDPQWYPANDEQRNGRGIRQGNMNPEIGIYDYSTVGSYDAQMWNLMAKKAGFIEGFMRGDPSLRTIEDLGEASQYEQAKALSISDPRIITLEENKIELNRARLRKSAFERDQYSVRERIAAAQNSVTRNRDALPHLRADLAQRQDISGDNFVAEVGASTFADRGEFGQAVFDRMEELADNRLTVTNRKIGEVSGFPITVDVSVFGKDTSVGLYLNRNGDRQERIKAQTPEGVASSIAGILRGFEKDVTNAEEGITHYEKQIADFTPQLDKTFTGQDEIDRLDAAVSGLERTLEAEAVARKVAQAAEAAPPAPIEGDTGPLKEAVSRRDVLSGIGATAVAASAPAIARTPLNGGFIAAAKGGDAQAVARWLSQSSKNPEYRRIARLLVQGGMGGTTIQVLEPGGQNWPAEAFEAIEGARGATLHAEKPGQAPRIYIRQGGEYDGMNEQTALHELIHGFISARYRSLSTYTASNRELVRAGTAGATPQVDAWTNLWRQISNTLDTKFKGLVDNKVWAQEIYRSPDEALTWTLTDPEAQAFLKSVDAEGNPVSVDKSAWAQFVDWVRGLFGMPAAEQRTALSDLLDAANSLIEAAQHDPADNRYAASMGEEMRAEDRMSERGTFGDVTAPDPLTVSEITEQARTMIGRWLGKGAETAVEDFRIWSQDRMLPVLRAEAAVEQSLGRELRDDERPYLAEELMAGRVATKLDRLSDDLVEPLFATMKAEGVTIDEVESYLYARHAPERNAHIASINPDAFEEGTGSGMTDVEAAAIMARIERDGKTAAMERVADRVEAILDFAREERVDAGLMSEEQAESWKTAYDHYVPLRGFAELDGADERPKTGQGLSVRGPESKRAYGRRSKADDILAHSIMQAQEAIVRGEKNRVARAFYDLAKAAPDADFWQVNKVSMQRRTNRETGLVETYPVTQMLAKDADTTVSLKIDGKERRVTMNARNPAAVKLAEAMRRLDSQKTHIALQTLQKLNRYYSAINTTYTPEFIISNAFRDIQAATVNLSGVDVPGIVKGTLRDYRKALVASTKGAFKKGDGEWADWWHEFNEAGGRVAYNQIDSIDSLTRDFQRHFDPARRPNPTGMNTSPKQVGLIAMGDVKAVFGFIDKVNIGVENAVRLATFKNAREAGVSAPQAASLAKNVTVNFNRRGTSQAMNAMYLFYNASVQGTARMFTALGNRRVQKIVAGIAVAGFLQELLNSMISPDDDDGEKLYDKIPEFEKSRNMIIMLPGGRYLKWPMPWGFNAFHALGRDMARLARGEAFTRVATDWLTTTVDAFNPIGGTNSILNALAPTVVDPIVDLARNRDFADRPIMPDQQQYGPATPDNQRYWSNVGPVWKSVTDVLNSATGGDRVVPGAIDISPETLEYLFGTVTGGAGAFVDRTGGAIGRAVDGDPATENTINDVPMVRRLVGSKPAWYDKAAFYARLNQIEGTRENARSYGEMGDRQGGTAYVAENHPIIAMIPAARAAKSQMRKVREAKGLAAVARDTGRITPEVYRERMTNLGDAEKRIITAFNAAYLRNVRPAVRP